MTDCIFCKIVEKTIPARTIAESTNFLAFLDVNPNTPGHTLIIPKKHCTTISDMPEYLGNEFVEFVQRVGAAIITAMKAEGYNLLHNNGPAAGQAVFHGHFHLIPRRQHDGVRILSDDPGTHVTLSDEQMAMVQAQIRFALK